MKYTEEKAKQLANMMRSFALKHELNVDITHDADVKNHVYKSLVYVFKAGWLPTEYVFCWDEVESLSEGAAYIFADMINSFHLRPTNNKYVRADVEATYNMYMNMTVANRHTVPIIQDVIFHNPATIIKWADGTKTVVKTQNGEMYDPEKGLAMAIAKKTLGNKGNYYNEIEKWLGKYEANAVNPVIEKLSKMIRDQIRQSLYDHPIKFVKEGLNSIYGRPAMKKDIVLEVNESIENTFTKDSLD